MIEMEDNSEGNTGPERPRLLLADDSPTIRKVVELTFSDEGIDVTAVGDAASAMEEFVKRQPDVVLVDVNLPGMSGYQICEIIKQDEATSNIPVLLLVGSFEPFDQDEAERVAADGFLLKPFKSIRELVGRVKELLAQSDAENGPAVESFDEMMESIPADSHFESTDSKVETNDIENLYEQSLIDTAEIQDFDTVDDLLIDPGMDDELIDAEYHSDTRPTQSADRSEPEVLDFRPVETNPFLSRVTEEETTASRTEGRHDPTNGVDHAASSGELKESEPLRSGKETNTPLEPSEELITLIANRVVERLSGREIREVAREVVPRIAEKLIREALAEEKKS